MMIGCLSPSFPSEIIIIMFFLSDFLATGNESKDSLDGSLCLKDYSSVLEAVTHNDDESCLTRMSDYHRPYDVFPVMAIDSETLRRVTAIGRASPSSSERDPRLQRSVYNL